MAADRPELVAALEADVREVGSLLFLPDGVTLVTASVGGPKKGNPPGIIRLWDLSGTQPELQSELRGHKDWIYSLACTPDRGAPALLACGGVRFDQRIWLWDVSQAKPVLRQTLPQFTTWWHHSLAFSPDGKYLATVAPNGAQFAPDGKNIGNIEGVDGLVQLWEVPGPGKSSDAISAGSVLSANDADAASAIAFSPDGKLLAAAIGSLHGLPRDGSIVLWDLAASPAKPLAVVKRHRRDVLALGFSPDGKTLVSAGWDKAMRFWRVTSRGLDELAEVPIASDPRSIAIHPQGTTVAVPEGMRVTLWDLATFKRLRDWSFPSDVRAIGIAPDGKHLAAGLASGAVYIVRDELGRRKETDSNKR